MCKKNVYHLSNMSRAEAEALLEEHEGRVCVRFYQREDGSILTEEDCPVGLAAGARKKLLAVAAKIAAGGLAASSAAAGLLVALPLPNSVRSLPVLSTFFDSVQSFVDTSPSDEELLRRYHERERARQARRQSHDYITGFASQSTAS
jgi:hypothetical protein